MSSEAIDQSKNTEHSLTSTEAGENVLSKEHSFGGELGMENEQILNEEASAEDTVFIPLQSGELAYMENRNFEYEDEDEDKTSESLDSVKEHRRLVRRIIASKILEPIDNRIFAEEVVMDKIERLDSPTNIAGLVVQDAIHGIKSCHNVLQKTIEDIIYEDFADEFKPSNIAVHEVNSDLLDRCTSTYRFSKRLICDVIRKFPSPYQICLDILNEDIIENMHYRRPVFHDDVQTCLTFTNYDKLAMHVVDKVFEDKTVSRALQAEIQPTWTPEKVFMWCTIKDFTIDGGLKQIYCYVGYWVYAESWKYNIYYIMAQSDHCSDFYLYEAKFGIPTNLYPIPQATASVFFTIEVSRVAPKNCPVKVTYVVEGNRLVHDTAREHQFQEAWLLSVVDAKLTLFKRIKF